MPVFKATWFFVQGNYGWTETMYRNGSSMTDVVAAWAPLTVARRTLMRAQVQLFRLRLSRTDQPNVVSIINYPGAQGNGNYPVGTTPDELCDAFIALLLNAFTEPGRKRTILLRGIPEVIDVNGVYTPSTTWTARLVAYIQACFTAAAAIRVAPLRTAETPITSLLVNADDPYYLNVTSGTERPDVGTLVGLRGVKIPFGARGIHRVNAMTGNGQYVLGPARHAYASLPLWDGKGWLKVLNYTAQDLVAITPSRIAKRDTGRPFGLPRGRRSVR